MTPHSELSIGYISNTIATLKLESKYESFLMFALVSTYMALKLSCNLFKHMFTVHCIIMLDNTR